MKFRTALFSFTLPALLVAGTAYAIQGKDKAPAPQGDNLGVAMEMPKPTAEHKWLQSRVGTWDCVVHCPVMGEPTKATEVATAFGEFWISSEFSGSYMGTPFQGKMLVTYDPMKQKYVSTWADSTMPTLFVMEGTKDAAGKKLTSTGMGPNMEGQIVEYTNVLELKSRDEMLFSMYETKKGADDPTAMKIEYKRRK